MARFRRGVFLGWEGALTRAWIICVAATFVALELLASSTLAATPRPKPDIGSLPVEKPLEAVAPVRSTLDGPERRTTDGASPRVLASVSRSCVVAGVTLRAAEHPATEDTECRIPDPVGLENLGGSNPIELRPEALVDCSFASDFTKWIKDAVIPAAEAELGVPVVGLQVAASYVCRRRNNLPDGKLSEHAKGNAVDVSVFRLADGREVTVENGWSGEEADQRFLKRVHAAACEQFLTVIGPDGDEWHQDHFHLDQGCHGKTCTYRICQ